MPGDLGMGTFRDEATPGVIQTGVRSWLGSSVRLKNDRDDGATFVILPGDRSYGAVQRGPTKNGCTLEFHGRGASTYGDWRDFIAYYGFGGRNACTAALDTFTLIVYVTSRAKYEVYTGCKINKVTITAPGPGKLLEFSVQIFAMDHSIETSLVITDIQNITIGAAPTEPSSSLLFWANNCQVNLGGGGLTTQYFQKWELSVDNHLERVEGVKTWYDGTKHQQTVELHEGEREVTFDGSLRLKDQTWDAAKIAGTKITALTIPIDDDTVTLSNGDIVPTEYTDLQQKAGEDHLIVRFPNNGLAIA
jgi:hypothetical protein